MKPSLLFFNVNGSGMGHLNRCLSYARHLRDRANCHFFSLASAMEVIESMGFDGDYYVSNYWSSNTTFSWNSELAVRFRLMLDQVRPQAVVFDGTWPYQGLMAALASYSDKPALIWSNRGLMKSTVKAAPVDRAGFDLIVEPGELGAQTVTVSSSGRVRTVRVPPVCLLDAEEILGRTQARAALGLPQNVPLALLSLGPGNLKAVDSIGRRLLVALKAEGFQAVWAQAPISVHDVELPADVVPVAVYPLAKYLRAFDVFIGAAGYNTCCEVVQAGVPALLVPNTQLADDQARRADLVAAVTTAVVSPCETADQCRRAITTLLQRRGERENRQPAQGVVLNGADIAAGEILALTRGRA